MRALRLNRSTPAVAMTLAVSALFAGCAGEQTPVAWTPTLEPSRESGGGADEQAALDALEALGTSSEAPLAPTDAIAGPAYTAATGRTCREVTGLREPRVACRFDEGWRFVPRLDGDQGSP